MKNHLLPLEKEIPKIITKQEGTTDKNFGCIPEQRPINQLIELGIININKPSGPTSHQIADFVKKMFSLNKTGHSGTLDPKVTGVLPVALSNATRIVQTLLPTGKEYIAIMRLHKETSQEKLEKTFKKFTGEISQLPPIRSAVKRRIRPRNIYYMEILETDGKNILFKVGCQAGTYIRKLIHDIGQDLKTGAHMAQLIRTKAGPFNDKGWHSLQDLRDAYETYKETSEEKELRKIIEPFENALKFIPKVWVFDSAISNICHGSQIAPQGISKLTDNIFEKDTVAVMSLKDELICLGKAIMDSKKITKKNEGIAIKNEKVFMDRTIYPHKKSF
jgi:H/ACA ribonucleoprotein complex subunit 4